MMRFVIFMLGMIAGVEWSSIAIIYLQTIGMI